MYIRDAKELRDKFTALYRQAEHLIMDGAIDVEVKKHKQTRSLEQNAYYHLICGEVAKFLDDAGLTYGEYHLKYTTKDLMHGLNKQIFGIDTTTKMSVGEFCEYMTKVIAFWQEKTAYEWMPSELPDYYMSKRGYTDNYTRGAIHDT